jgi:hypothetical protein
MEKINKICLRAQLFNSQLENVTGAEVSRKLYIYMGLLFSNSAEEGPLASHSSLLIWVLNNKNITRYALCNISMQLCEM